MWKKIENYIEKNQMLKKNDTVIIGLSGGADSLCLTEFFLHIKDSLNLRLYAVHINHMLRDAEADRDEAFVRDYCKRNDLSLQVCHKDIRALASEMQVSEEEAGRLYRYEVFENLRAGFGEDAKIAVAHHKNDQAETLLFRMARGTGPKGLMGMSPVSGKLIRPLLCVSREEIEEILAKRSEDYVTDSSNLCDDHDRNLIRNQVMPELTKINRGATNHISMLAQKMQELYAYLEPKLDQLFLETTRREDAGLLILEEVFRGLCSFEQNEIIRRSIYEAAHHKKDITTDHVEKILGLMNKAYGKQLTLPYELVAFREKEGIRLSKRSVFEKTMEEKKEGSTDYCSASLDFSQKKELCLTLPAFMDYSAMTFRLKDISELSKLDFKSESLKNDCVQYFDYDKINNGLLVRIRRSGDYLTINKEGKHKQLKRFFIDRKIPQDMRDRLPLLCDGAHVLWVPGERISTQYMVSDKTRQVLMVSIEVKEKF